MPTPLSPTRPSPSSRDRSGGVHLSSDEEVTQVIAYVPLAIEAERHRGELAAKGLVQS